jgi:peptidoglycan/xylan/chitin deacetylase (PgdA/CDA1 family)
MNKYKMSYTLKRRVINYFTPYHQIYMYHRIKAGGPNYFRMNVKLSIFERQVNAISSKTIPLLKVIQKITKGYLIWRRSCSITFDDGYADNYFTVFPLIKRYKIPITIFISTDNIERSSNSWADKYELLLDKINDESLLHEILNRIDPIFKETKHDQIHLIFRRMIDEDRRNYILEKAKNNIGANFSILKENLMLTEKMIREMSESGLVEFGAHTASHPCLSRLSYEDQKTEILKSKKILENITKKNIDIFAYPYGGKDCYNEKTIKILKELRFKAAVIVKAGVIRIGDDPYELKRKMVTEDMDIGF